MRRIINNKVYDTETALRLASWRSGRRGKRADEQEAALFVKRTGEYFLYAKKAGEATIKPLTEEEAREWAGQRVSGEYARIFGGDGVGGGADQPAGRADSGEPCRLFNLMLPVSIIDDLRRRKSETGIHASTQVTKLLREAGYGAQGAK